MLCWTNSCFCPPLMFASEWAAHNLLCVVALYASIHAPYTVMLCHARLTWEVGLYLGGGGVLWGKYEYHS